MAALLCIVSLSLDCFSANDVALSVALASSKAIVPGHVGR